MHNYQGVLSSVGSNLLNSINLFALHQQTKTRITICIDTDIPEWFRDEAERAGQGYQTAMNQALRNYIRQDKRPIQDIVRKAVRQELLKFRKAG